MEKYGETMFCCPPFSLLPPVMHPHLKALEDYTLPPPRRRNQVENRDGPRYGALIFKPKALRVIWTKWLGVRMTMTRANTPPKIHKHTLPHTRAGKH